MGGIFTKAVVQHIPQGVFDGCAYIARNHLRDVACEHIPLGSPCRGYSYCLIVGTPRFIMQHYAQAGGAVVGVYALPQTQFVPIDQVAWLNTPMRVATPSVMSSEALRLAADNSTRITEVPLWGAAAQPETCINRTEIQQTLAPEWKGLGTVVMAHVSCARLALAALAKLPSVRAILLGSVPAEQRSSLLSLYGIDPKRVCVTQSELAWRAADLYISVDPVCYWPWDVMTAISYRVPVACIETHVYESIISHGECALNIAAHDAICGEETAYCTNSSDIAAAISNFCQNRISAQIRADNAQRVYSCRTPKMFTEQLIRELFAMN
jgi:hypothetical protein